MSALDYIPASSLDPAKHKVYGYGPGIELSRVERVAGGKVALHFADGSAPARLYSGTMVRIKQA